MSEKELIKNYFYAANSLVIYLMYLEKYPKGNIESNLKKYNPGHLGTSLSVNFLLANLYYFLNKYNIKSNIFKDISNIIANNIRIFCICITKLFNKFHK